jgi:hypothetical protein
MGEKHYTALVVGELMGMERWWNDTDRGKLKYWDRKCVGGFYEDEPVCIVQDDNRYLL